MTTQAYRGLTSLGPSYVYSKFLRIPINLSDPTFLIQLFLECGKEEEVIKLSEDILNQRPDFDLRGTCKLGLEYIFGTDYANRNSYLLDGIPECEVMSVLYEETDIDMPKPPKSKQMHIVEDDFLEVDIYDGEFDYVIDYLYKIEQVITQSSSAERRYLIDLYNSMDDDERKDWQGVENVKRNIEVSNEYMDLDADEELLMVAAEIDEAKQRNDGLCKDGPNYVAGIFNTNVVVNQLSVQNIVVQVNQDAERSKVMQQVHNMKLLEYAGEGPSKVEPILDELESEHSDQDSDPEIESNLSDIQQAAVKAKSTEDVLRILRSGTKRARIRYLYRPIHDGRLRLKIARFLKDNGLEFKQIFAVNSTGCYVPTFLFRKDARFEKWLEKFEEWGMNPV